MRNGAVWLASYPKSGNTWARLALFALRGSTDQELLAGLGGFGTTLATYEVMDRRLGVEAGHLTYAEIDALRPDLYSALFRTATAPVLCKVHDAWARAADGRPVFDADVTAGAIYLVRDPRDVAISWARFTGWSLEDAIDMLARPDMTLDNPPHKRTMALPQKLGSWSRNVTSWIDESGLDPLLIRYEDMIADLPMALRQMAIVSGCPADDAAIAAAVTATQFDRLAEQEQRHGFLERAERTERFFRAGRAGQWRDVLTADQARRIEREHRTVMTRLGYL